MAISEDASAIFIHGNVFIVVSNECVNNLKLLRNINCILDELSLITALCDASQMITSTMNMIQEIYQPFSQEPSLNSSIFVYCSSFVQAF